MKPLAARTFLRPGDRAAVIGGPVGFAVAGEPEDVDPARSLRAGPFDWILVFVTRADEARAVLPEAKAAMVEGARLWVAYPKGGAKAAVPTDLDRDILWREAKPMDLEGVAMVAIDQTWSAMRLKPA